MTLPSFVRRWRTRVSDVQTNRLRAQLAKEKDRSRAMAQRLDLLQDANLGAYHALSIANGIPCLRANCSLCAAAKAGMS